MILHTLFLSLYFKFLDVLLSHSNKKNQHENNFENVFRILSKIFLSCFTEDQKRNPRLIATKQSFTYNSEAFIYHFLEVAALICNMALSTMN